MIADKAVLDQKGETHRGVKMKKKIIAILLAVMLFALAATSALAVIGPAKTTTYKPTVVSYGGAFHYWHPVYTTGQLELSKLRYKGNPVVIRATPVQNLNTRLYGKDLGLTLEKL
jgi:hypothetical protein